MKTKSRFLEEILQYNKNYDTELIGRAYDKAKELHQGQLRKSGEPYLIHPVAVAIILAELGMDDETLVGGLLHDAVEDTSYTIEQLTADFGREVALLVEGVTKLGTLKFDSKEEEQAENYRRMFLAMSKDIRVLIIKLADRLHNMRTIEYMTPEKVIEKSQETLDIYAPLADRLGIYTVKNELENTALKYLHPAEYEAIEQALNEKKLSRGGFIDGVIEELRAALDKMGMHYEISGRMKQIYSIYHKMIIQQKQIDEIFDLIAVRVIVDTVRDCYAVLGQVHTMWKPIPGKFKDYIAMPKPNMYQSLHTSVLAAGGQPFEIQIRTYEMHRVAEYGIAAHWKYKKGDTSGVQNSEDVKLSWLRQTLEWQKDMKDPKEFMETLKVDLFSSQVFVFTPQGDVLDLPAGSTPLDFAFKIHTDVGLKCVGARVNGKMVTIDHPLRSGDIVEIVTSASSSGPSVDWLKIAKSSTAKAKIRQFLNRQNSGNEIARGKEALEKYVRKKGYEPQTVLRANYLNNAWKQLNFNDLNEAYKQISQGGTVLSKFGSLLIDQKKEDEEKERKRKEEKAEAILKQAQSAAGKNRNGNRQSDSGLYVKGADNLLIRTARCCNPVPGDEITGFITKGRGITVHRKDCSNVTSLPPEERGRCIEVFWEKPEEGKSYQAELALVCSDRKGLLSDISKVCDEMDIAIEGLNGRVQKDGKVRIILTLSIVNTEEMQRVLRALRSIPSVMNVYRSQA